jgi:hypothetical protein
VLTAATIGDRFGEPDTFAALDAPPTEEGAARGTIRRPGAEEEAAAEEDEEEAAGAGAAAMGGEEDAGLALVSLIADGMNKAAAGMEDELTSLWLRVSCPGAGVFSPPPPVLLALSALSLLLLSALSLSLLFCTLTTSSRTSFLNP